MFRRPILLLLIAFVLGGRAVAGPFVGGRSLSDPLVHRASKFIFPAKFGTFERALPQQYDATGEDFSVAYDSLLPPISITIFVYPSKGRSLKDELARREHEITIVHPDARLVSHGKQLLSPGHKPGAAASYRYQATFADMPQPVLSAILLAQHGERFVAYRVVYPASARSLAEPAAQKFEETFLWP